MSHSHRNRVLLARPFLHVQPNKNASSFLMSAVQRRIFSFLSTSTAPQGLVLHEISVLKLSRCADQLASIDDIRTSRNTGIYMPSASLCFSIHLRLRRRLMSCEFPPSWHSAKHPCIVTWTVPANAYTIAAREPLHPSQAFRDAAKKPSRPAKAAVRMSAHWSEVLRFIAISCVSVT